MKLFNFLRKKEEAPKKPTLTADQKVAKGVAITKHRRRIRNLSEELEQISNKLESVESDFNKTRNEREKESDAIIRRMTFIKYEIEIREGLTKWLS